jgi:hypothetical protein
MPEDLRWAGKLASVFRGFRHALTTGAMTPREIWDGLGITRQGAIKRLHIGGHRFKLVPSVCSAYRGNPPIVKIQPSLILLPMKDKIKNCMAVMCVATSALALSALLVGCDREVSSTKSSSESSDGAVKSKETSVSKSSDGTVTKTEETKKVTPPDKP